MNISEFINQHLEHLIGVLIRFTPKIISAVLFLIIGLWLIKRLSIIADKAMLKREIEISLRTFLRSLMSIGLKIVLIVTVAGMIGIGTTSFVTILGAAGLAVGLALQGSLSNFAGGVLILIFKPFKVGDTIEAQGQIGKVTEIQIFNTILTTFDKKIVILPNGALSNNTIINASRNGIVRVDIQLTLSLENDLNKIIEIINNVVNSQSAIIKDPPPLINVDRIADGMIRISIKPHCEIGIPATVISELNIQLKDEFEKNGIKQFIPKA